MLIKMAHARTVENKCRQGIKAPHPVIQLFVSHTHTHTHTHRTARQDSPAPGWHSGPDRWQGRLHFNRGWMHFILSSIYLSVRRQRTVRTRAPKDPSSAEENATRPTTYTW